MKVISLFFSLFILFSACTSKPSPYTKEKNTEKKIQSNQSQALSAQDEYKRLQAKRQKE
ncbi:hypothetical protein MNB_SV-13-1673 [hydrothermal vent metagenome]|uniref:Lipoprotein n=1 Tax=hydrothermal vent metagenome TaxID=652676 RepID=A0A1W1CDR4_9ZZZZ